VASKFSFFLAELKQRKVGRVAAVYLVVGLGVLGAAEVILDPLGLEALRPYVVVLVILGFPIALVLAWAYEVSPEKPRRIEPSPDPGLEAQQADRRRSIVVLPFDNMSPDPGDAYFSDGLTEEIITDLSHLNALRVISRSSAMALKGTRKDVRTVGRELDVQFVLEGSVRKAGNELRITAQLIDASSDEHLWAEKYDGVLEDVFRIQEEVSRSIVAQLAVRLSPKEDRLFSARPIGDVPAYQCYLRARQHVWDGTPESLEKALGDLETALGMVGDNALIFAGLGYVFFQMANLGVQQDEAIEKAEGYARRALELDPECAEAEVVLGASRQAFFGDQRQSIEHSERARRLAPSNPDAVLWLANANLITGQMDAARALTELLVQLDPLTVVSHAQRACMHVWRGEMDLAVESSRRGYELAPSSPISVWLFAYSLASSGRIEEFKEVRERGLPEDSLLTRFALLYEAAAKDEHGTVTDLISADIERTALRDPQWSYFLVGPLARVGEGDRAVDWLENAVRQGFINYPAMMSHPFHASLLGDSRFEEISERVKQDWEAFEV
jgi:TolB-like protein